MNVGLSATASDEMKTKLASMGSDDVPLDASVPVLPVSANVVPTGSVVVAVVVLALPVVPVSDVVVIGVTPVDAPDSPPTQTPAISVGAFSP